MAIVALILLGLPLLAFVVNVFITHKNKALSATLAILAMAIAVVLAFYIAVQVSQGQTDHLEINWLRLQPQNVASPPTEPFLRLGVQVDPLAAVMLIVVTVVSFLVHVYSRSYMIEHGHYDPGYSRFFAYLD